MDPGPDLPQGVRRSVSTVVAVEGATAAGFTIGLQKGSRRSADA